MERKVATCHHKMPHCLACSGGKTQVEHRILHKNKVTRCNYCIACFIPAIAEVTVGQQVCHIAPGLQFVSY